MTISYKDFLFKIQNAKTEEEKSWIVLEFNLQTLEDNLQNALYAVSIPHWFEEVFISNLLEVDPLTSSSLLNQLKSLSYIESTEIGYAVHEHTRKLLLNHLWMTNPNLYRLYSIRAMDYCDNAFKNSKNLLWHLESLYHLPLAHPDEWTKVCEQILEWQQAPSMEYEKANSLLRLIKEHIDEQRSLNPEITNYVTFLQANSFKISGKLLFFQERYELAERQYQQAINLYKTINDKKNEADCIYRLGTIDENLHNLLEAQEHYSHALNLYDNSSYEYEKATCLESLGRLNSRMENYELAKEHYQQAITILDKLEDKQEVIKTTLALGEIHFKFNYLQAAEELYKQAYKLSVESEEILWEANSLLLLGGVYYQGGEKDSAIDCYQKAYDIYTQRQMKGGQVNAIYALGYVYNYFGNYDLALDKLNKAYDLFSELGNEFYMASCAKLIGDIFYELDNYKQSETYYRRAIWYFGKLGYSKYEIECREQLINMYSYLGNTENVVNQWEDLIIIYLNNGDIISEARCKGAIGDIFVKEAKYKEAVTLYNQALSLLEKNNLNEPNLMLAHILRGFGIANYHLENYGESKIILQKSLEIYNQIKYTQGINECQEYLKKISFNSDTPPTQTHFQPNLAIQSNLQEKITQYLIESELRVVCFTLNIAYEHLAGRTYHDKVISLIRYCQQHNQLEQLVSVCQKTVPHTQWS